MLVTTAQAVECMAISRIEFFFPWSLMTTLPNLRRTIPKGLWIMKPVNTDKMLHKVSSPSELDPEKGQAQSLLYSKLRESACSSYWTANVKISCPPCNIPARLIIIKKTHQIVIIKAKYSRSEAVCMVEGRNRVSHLSQSRSKQSRTTWCSLRFLSNDYA